MKGVLCKAKRQSRVLLAVVLMICWVLPSDAQKISIERFKRVKKDLLNKTPLPVDKKQATLDLLTDEKGFTFKRKSNHEFVFIKGPHRHHVELMKLGNGLFYFNIRK